MRTFSVEELPAIAALIIDKVQQHEAQGVALIGNLGSGKTTLVQHIAQRLGVAEAVVSPTFILMKKYKLQHPMFKQLVHVDAYRIEGRAEAKQLACDLHVMQGDFWCIEWPAHLHGHVPAPLVQIQLQYVDESTRGIIGL